MTGEPTLSSTIVEVQDLHKDYGGVRALNGLTMTIGRTRFTAS